MITYPVKKLQKPPLYEECMDQYRQYHYRLGKRTYNLINKSNIIYFDKDEFPYPENIILENTAPFNNTFYKPTQQVQPPPLQNLMTTPAQVQKNIDKVYIKQYQHLNSEKLTKIDLNLDTKSLAQDQSPSNKKIPSTKINAQLSSKANYENLKTKGFAPLQLVQGVGSEEDKQLMIMG